MKKKSSISFGPGASSLILIFVVLTMSVLGILSLMNGRNDARLSKRSVQVIEAVYQLNEKAEARRAELDRIMGALKKMLPADTVQADYEQAIVLLAPEGVQLKDGALCWRETDGARVLDCELTILPFSETGRTVWQRHDLSAKTEEESW